MLLLSLLAVTACLPSLVLGQANPILGTKTLNISSESTQMICELCENLVAAVLNRLTLVMLAQTTAPGGQTRWKASTKLTRTIQTLP